MPKTEPPPETRTESEVAGLFRLAADETRLKLLAVIAGAPGGAVCVSDLCAAVGQAQPAVSHHLALLRVSGVVESRRSGKRNLYSLLGPGRLLVAAARDMMAGGPRPGAQRRAAAV